MGKSLFRLPTGCGLRVRRKGSNDVLKWLLFLVRPKCAKSAHWAAFYTPSKTSASKYLCIGRCRFFISFLEFIPAPGYHGSQQALQKLILTSAEKELPKNLNMQNMPRDIVLMKNGHWAQDSSFDNFMPNAFESGERTMLVVSRSCYRSLCITLR